MGQDREPGLLHLTRRASMKVVILVCLMLLTFVIPAAADIVTVVDGWTITSRRAVDAVLWGRHDHVPGAAL
jgi:hypothetical protein